MRLAYISDQRYYQGPDGHWYAATACLLDQMEAGLPALKKWIVYGRLNRVANTEHLFRMPRCKQEIEYVGPWETKSGPLGQLLSLPAQIRLLRSVVKEVDVVWLRLPFVAAILAWFCCDLKGKLVISQMIGYPHALTFIYGEKWRFFEKLLNYATRKIVKTVDLAVFVSQALADDFGRQCKEILIANESSLEEWRICRGEERVKRKDILFVGRLSPEKGIKVLLKAYARIAHRYPEIGLRLIGDGPSKAELEQLAVQEGIGDRVAFAGYQTWESVLSAMQNGAMMILPSYTEGLGLVLVEAMSQSIPVIASKVGGILEIVVHEKNGLLIQPGDVNGLAEAMVRLIEDETLVRKLTKGGLETARQNTFEYQTGKILNFINQKIKNGGI